MIDITEQFDCVKAEKKDKNVLILRKLENKVTRWDKKKADYEIEYRWLSKNDIHCVLGQEYSYWTEKELNMNISLFEQLNLF